MALRDKIETAVRPHLQEGEELQAVFWAQTHSQWLAPLVGFIPFIFINRYRTVAVTNHRIAVFDSGRWSTTKAHSLALVLPRATVLGPGSGIWHPIEVAGQKLRVHRRFFKDLRAADALLAPTA
jgi:hypothetical protein